MAAQHGGPRVPGPGKKLGRPPKPDKKQTVSMRFSPDVAAFVRSQANYSQWTEDAVRRTAAFRKWISTRS